MNYISKNRLTSPPRQHIFDQSQTSFPHHRVVAFHAKVQCRCHIVDDASRSFFKPIQHNILPNLHTHMLVYAEYFSISQVVSVCFSNRFLFICVSLLYHFFLLPLPYFRRKTTRKSHITGRVEDKNRHIKNIS